MSPDRQRAAARWRRMGSMAERLRGNLKDAERRMQHAVCPIYGIDAIQATGIHHHCRSRPRAWLLEGYG